MFGIRKKLALRKGRSDSDMKGHADVFRRRSSTVNVTAACEKLVSRLYDSDTGEGLDSTLRTVL